MKIKKIFPNKFMWVVLGVTFGLLALSINLWSSFPCVKFQTNLQKDTLYQVFYTQNADDPFNEQMSVKQLVKAGQREVIIDLPIYKLARFRLDFGNNPGKVEISDLKIDGRSVVLFDDFSKFSFRNIVKPKMEKNKISFDCDHRDPYIIYKDKLALKGGRSVDFYVLIILATLYFLIAYKVVRYLSRFKIEEHHSRIDIVFLTVFFALLFVPMLHISEAEKSIQENRMLAKYKPIFQDNKFNLNFGRDFDAWFSNRFWGREKIIKLVSTLTYNLSSIYSNKKAVYLKENGWMFNFPLVDNPLLENKITEINRTIQKFDEFLEDKGIKFYVLLVPRKESIYQNELLDYGYDKQKDEKFQQSIQRIMAADEKKQIIYPYQELMDAKQQDYVFFKQAHHWTDWGAYQGYEKLMKRINADFPDINIASLDEYKQSTSTKIRDDWYRDFNSGHTTNLLNLKERADEILSTEYKYYDRNNQMITEKRKKYIKEFFNENGKYKIFLTGNSQNEDLLQFLSYSAKELKYLRLNMAQVPNKETFKFMKHYKKELLEFKPDIVVFSISVGALSQMTDFYKD